MTYSEREELQMLLQNNSITLKDAVKLLTAEYEAKTDVCLDAETEERAFIQNIMHCTYPTFDAFKEVFDIVDNSMINYGKIVLIKTSLVECYNKVTRYMNCSDITHEGDEIFILIKQGNNTIKIVEGKEDNGE